MFCKRKLIGSLLLVSALSSGSWVLAEESSEMSQNCKHERSWFKGKHHAEGPVGMMKHMLNRLDLTDQQHTQIYALIDAATPQLRDLMRDMKKQRKALHDLAMAEPLDQAAIEMAADQQAQLLKQMILQGSQLRSSIFALLTPEQREEVTQRMQKKRRF